MPSPHFDAHSLKKELDSLLDGDVMIDEKTRDEYSRDTSLFKVTPEVVVFPKHVEDVKRLARFVRTYRNKDNQLSVTGRSAGTDMTGGPLTESIVAVFTRYFTKKIVNEERMEAYVEPGVYYRDFEKETLPEHITMPVYPASKRMAAFGGMIMNNCGGENSLRYGQMRNFVKELKVVLADGNEYTLKKLTKSELERKIAQGDFEGELYRKTFDLLEANYELIKRSKPRTTKNSSGYALWDVYDREKGEFDLTQLFTGSQGTLGILTGATLKLRKTLPYNRLITLFFSSWEEVPEVVNQLLPYSPESLETFDSETLKLGLRFMPEIAKRTGVSLGEFLTRFFPELLVGVRMLGLPKLIILVELAEESLDELERKTQLIDEMLQHRKVLHRILRDPKEAEKYWVMRRESFNLLRQRVKGKQTAPFIEDFAVLPEKVPEFLPKALRILKRYDIKANLAGHAGNGNFHIIPLMDLSDERERKKIIPVAREFYELVNRYEGTITAEHNDGIIRTPFIRDMFGPEMYALFREVKFIFDPQNIFNPGKKVGGTVEYIEKHIAS